MRMIDKIACFIGALLASCALLGCSVDSPVSGDYFNNLDKVKGGEKPDPPMLVGVAHPQADAITVTFNTDLTKDPPVTGTNDHLYYLVYCWNENPVLEFDDEKEYYSADYYIGYVKESDYDEPDDVDKEVSFSLNPDFSGTLYFWMTSYDGGRESDQSNVVSITIP
jgi:hypothetical protein